MEITKDAEKVLCCIYKIYLERRKDNISKSQAVEFDSDFYKNDKHLSKMDNNDIYECIVELKENGCIKMYIDGSFILLNSTIVYMENRFKNGLNEIFEILSKFL